MATDKTWFDDRLKRPLVLDIAFRAGVWLCIAFVTFKHVSKSATFSPVAGLETAFNVLMPVMVAILPWCLVLCFFAMLLKDLEKVDDARWGQGALVGRLGGVVRRLAGDLTLWILGALVSVASSVAVVAYYAYREHTWSDEITHFIVLMIMLLGIPFAVFAYVSTWVRRDVSLVSSHANLSTVCNTSWKVLVFYLLLIGCTAVLGRQ